MAGRAAFRAPTLLWAAGGLLLGFLIGFGWQYARAERVEARADYAARALEAARLEATLGDALIDVQQGNFELGRQRTSDFFTGAQRRLLPALATAPATAARELVGERDVTITALARNDPASASVLARLLTRYREVVRRAGLDSAVAVPAAR